MRSSQELPGLDILLVFSQYHAARIRHNELVGSLTRHNVPAESMWLFYLISVLLHLVGFEGDDAVSARGLGPLAMAKSEAEFLLQRGTETYQLLHSIGKPVSVEYSEYDPLRTLDEFFPHRRPPSSFDRVPTREQAAVRLSIGAAPERIPDSHRVVESTLVALSRVPTRIQVETTLDGRVLSVSPDSVRAVIAEMVSPHGHSSDAADPAEGERRLVVVGSVICESPGSPTDSEVTIVEDWVSQLVSSDT